MIAYRDGTPGDAALMSRLGKQTFVETFGHLYTPENLAAFLDNHSEENWRGELSNPAFAIRIAKDAGEAAGFAKVGPPSLPFEPTGPTAELRQLYVLKPWHGVGIAHALMDWVIAEAKRRGAEQLYLSVFVDNHRARRFYDRYGFEAVGTYDFMVGTHADLDIIMRKQL
ncbi:GNAT family N-acetyltransferase [Sphingosinicella sp. YJ22]|uniref:GNAT family N-acetyltransferase n=1 Tax=Sphingosinicella sp. YJ22 TaxID=1104780 RepID=UPI001FB0192D|nr:GNAT family N-acetyltransferase [Sphingosinicella sp. YJ22]